MNIIVDIGPVFADVEGADQNLAIDLISTGIGLLALEVDVLIWFGSSVMTTENHRQTISR